MDQWIYTYGGLGQKQISRAETNNYIPQNLWDVITCACPWYLLLAKHSSFIDMYLRLTCNTGLCISRYTGEQNTNINLTVRVCLLWWKGCLKTTVQMNTVTVIKSKIHSQVVLGCVLIFFFVFNSPPPSASYLRQWMGSALVQIMACRLFGVKPLSKPILGYRQLEPQEQT